MRGGEKKSLMRVELTSYISFGVCLAWTMPLQLEGRSPHGEVVNVLDCDIVMSSNSSCTMTFTFGLMLSGKV